MDGDNGLNMRNWGYYEAAAAPSLRSHLGLQLMSPMPEKPLLDTRSNGLMGPSSGGPFHHHHRDMGTSHTMFPMDYMRDTWITNREKFLNVLPVNHNYSMIPETSSTAHQHMQMVQPSDLVKEEAGAMAQVEEVGMEMENNNVNGPSKKRQQGPKAQKSPKPKKAKKAPRVPKPESAAATTPSAPRARAVKKPTEVMINGINMDISSIPIPVCSCTGTPQQCYRWGSGGWQSACCTTGLSMYPLPMSTKRRGARIAGRKMSLGAFKKVLEKHAAEGYNFANPIDLRTHWAKHGTNKFVTIR